LLGLLLASLGAGAQPQPARYVPLLEAGDAVPSIPLIAQDGRPFRLSDLHGKAVVVSFIYTRCRDARMCPLVAAKFARIAHAVGSAPIRLVLLTLDPAYDTPRVLRAYGRAIGQDVRRFTLATGGGPSVSELAGRLGIATASTVPGVLVHTEAAVVIGPDGRIARTIAGNAWSEADLLEAAGATLPGGKDDFIGLRTWLGAALERCGGGNLAFGGAALIGIFGTALALVGGAFWLAFRTPAVRPKPKRN